MKSLPLRIENHDPELPLGIENYDPEVPLGNNIK